LGNGNVGDPLDSGRHEEIGVNAAIVSNDVEIGVHPNARDVEAVKVGVNSESPMKDKHAFLTSIYVWLSMMERQLAHHAFVAKAKIEEKMKENMSFRQAKKLLGKKAVRAVAMEMSKVHGMGTFLPVLRRRLTWAEIKKIIGSKLFLKQKFNPDGTLNKVKGHIVAGGHRQERKDYPVSATSSPTPQFTSVLTIFAIAADEGRDVATADVGNAYLNASMPDDQVVHMKLDRVCSDILIKIEPRYRDYQEEDGTMVVQLMKALYGCVQSAKLWYLRIRGALEKWGYIMNPLDQCVFNKDCNGLQCTICVYVDHLLITCKESGVVDGVLNKLKDEFKELTVRRGKQHDYLGMSFEFEPDESVKVSMDGYVKDIITEYEVTGTSKTPAAATLYEIDENSPALRDDDKVVFHSRVAKLLYLSKRAAPEILTAINFLTTRVLNPTKQDWKKLDKVLKNLNNGTQHFLRIKIARQDGEICVRAYVDASHGVHHNCRGQGGMVITLGTGPVFVKCWKLKIATKSSTESELVTMSDGASQVIWLREFLIAQGHEVKASVIYQDNTSAMKINDRGYSNSEKTRHINIRYYWIKDRMETGDVVVEYLSTKEMIADILTKPLGYKMFKVLRAALTGRMLEDKDCMALFAKHLAKIGFNAGVCQENRILG
jgi:hypothetical protein